MEQRAIAGRDLTQVGRDFVQKIFDSSVSNQYFSQINVLNPDDSEIKAYLSFWKGLDSEHRISLVLNCREYIRQTYRPKNFKQSSSFSSQKLFVVLFLCFFLIVQNKNHRNLLLKGEYMVFTTYCHISQDMLIPVPTCTVPKKVSKKSQQETELKKEFENYQKSWFEFFVSSLIIPWIISSLILRIFKYPIINYQKAQVEKKNKLIKQENELMNREKMAKEQTYNILFNLLNESEQNHVRKLEEALAIQEIKAQVSAISHTLSIIAPGILNESNLEKIVNYVLPFFPNLNENLKVEVIASLYPKMDKQKISTFLKGEKVKRLRF
jgi:hypothetical protein